MSEEPPFDTYGAGPTLDEDLDFSIDPTGDIESLGGLTELEKDLGWQLKVSLRRFEGESSNTNVESKAQDTAEKVAEADGRITTVDSRRSDAVVKDNGRTIEVTLVVNTINEERMKFIYQV